MVFDIVATNAESAHPRPLYWLRQIRSDGHIRLADAAAPWLFGSRYGLRPEAETDSLLLDAAAHVVARMRIRRHTWTVRRQDGSLVAFRADGTQRVCWSAVISMEPRNLSGQPTRAWATAHTPTPTITSPTPR